MVLAYEHMYPYTSCSLDPLFFSPIELRDEKSPVQDFFLLERIVYSSVCAPLTPNNWLY